MKTPGDQNINFVRYTSKTIKAVAKINLLHLLNESVTKPIKNLLKTEHLCDKKRREKIKSEFHQPSIQYDLDPYTNLDSSFVKNKNLSYIFKENNNRLNYYNDGSGDSPLKFNFRNDLNEFIKKHNPEKEMLGDLVTMLRNYGLNMDNEQEYREMHLPSPKKYNRIEIMTMSSGKYVHFGVERFLKRVLKMNGIKVQDDTNKVLYIDIAFYVIKSMKKDIGLELPQHLVILGRPAGGYYNHNCKEPFVIGIYEGLFTSSTIANEILRPFVDEMLSIRDNKITHTSNMIFSVQIRAIISDPIANSLVTCTSLPDSLFGCSKCNLNGKLEFNHSITSYPDFCQTCNLRSDDDFLYPEQIDHHTGIPILRELEIGLISQFYIDYKYTVCLGVMKRLLELWMFKGKLDYRLNKKTINAISNELESISKSVPKEFLAKPKTLQDDLKYWTSYDYRQFLLYYGPVVLQKRLPQKYYVNFLHLNLALRIMINPDTQIQYSANICSGLLNNFVTEFSKLYGPDLIDYNIHNLLHLDDVIFKSFSIDSVGGFLYDKQMDFITTNIMNGIELESLIPRIEENTECILENKKNLSTMNYPYLDANNNLICRYAMLSKNEPDNYVITTKDEIVIIDEITKVGDENEIIIYGRPATSVIMYQAPVTIQKMMLMMAKLSRQVFKLKDIKAKAVKISTTYGDYILPLLTP